MKKIKIINEYHYVKIGAESIGIEFPIVVERINAALKQEDGSILYLKTFHHL